MSISHLIRPELLNTPNFTPGANDATHRLHANELPWSPTPDDAFKLNFYPDNRLLDNLHKQLAKLYQVNSNELIITRGSD